MAKACLLAATRSPVIFSPVSLFPENVKTGIGDLSFAAFFDPGDFTKRPGNTFLKSRRRRRI
jgi:hypothetical protein